MLLSIEKSEFSYHVSMLGKLYKRCYSSTGTDRRTAGSDYKQVKRSQKSHGSMTA